MFKEEFQFRNEIPVRGDTNDNTATPAGYDCATQRNDLKSLGAKQLVSATISLHFQHPLRE